MSKIYGLIKSCTHKYKMILVEDEQKNLQHFYMTKGQFKSYIKHTDGKKNIYVKLTYNDSKFKVYSNYNAYQTTSLDMIETVTKEKSETLYINESSDDYIASVLNYDGYKLFMDYEFTMGQRGDKKFEPEIIQAGIIVTDENDKIVYEYSNYIETKNKVTERCMRFLDLDEEILKDSIKREQFYKDYKEIVDIYNPIAYTWGGSDDVELSYFFKLNKFKPILVKTYDLSEMIRKFYKLPETVGLFRALKIFKDIKVNQEHHALTDSAVTKDIYDEFKADSKRSEHIDVIAKLQKIKEEDRALRELKKQARKNMITNDIQDNSQDAE